MKLSAYWKTIVHALGAVLVAVLPLVFVTDHLTNSEWVNVAIAGVGALTVYFGPNVPGAAYTKGILAALTAGLTVLSSAITGGVNHAEWVQIGVAVLTALGVFGTKNMPRLYPATDQLDSKVV